MSEWSNYLSVISILGTIGVYFLHDRKLKKQEKRLNELSIAKAEKERLNEMRADIFVEWRNGRFTFCKIGKADATNVSATISDYEFDRPVFKPVLHPGETFQRTLKAGNPPETTTVKCTWDDGTGSKSKDYNIELFPF